MKRFLLFFAYLQFSIIATSRTYTINENLWVGQNYMCSVSDYINKQSNISDRNFDFNIESGIFTIIWKSDIAYYLVANKYVSGNHYVTCNWDAYNMNTHTTEKMTARWNITFNDNPIVLDTKKLNMTVNGSDYMQEIKHHFMFQNEYTATATIEYRLTYNNGVAKVNDNGYVQALKPGETEVQVISNISQDIQRVKIIVEDINVESATIPSSIEVLADQSKTLSVTVTPSNATVKTKNWYSATPSTARIDESTGELTGVWPGTTKVWCTVNGTVKSNEATVTVKEPSFTFSEFSIQNGATSVETLPTITATYSLALSRGDHFNEITLKDNSGNEVNGTTSINGTMLTFKPSKHLLPLTRYTLTIPAGAVKNKWGTAFSTSRSVTFTTTDWQRMTLEVLPEGKFLNRGDQITLTCSEPTATIYYSTDGSNPSQRYTEPLTLEGGSMTLRAMAKLDGYYDTDLIEKEFFQSVEVVEKFPDTDPLYIYTDVTPSITYSYPIEQGNAFSDIVLKNISGEIVDCQLIIEGATLYIVPTEPLLTGSAYTVTVPEGSLFTDKGEANKALDWHFSTGDFAMAVSAGGPELMTAIKTDGSLWTWGRQITDANAADGSYSYTVQTTPATFATEGVVAVSSGYMHHALIKRDGSLWMWGRQYCGEFGNGSTTASPQPIKVMDGVRSVTCGLQNTAIIKDDGTLWMCGRNDMGQIDDSYTVKQQFVLVAEGVEKATLGYGFLKMVKADGTTETRTWDETIDAHRKPAMTDNSITTELVSVEYGWKNAVALGKDGSVWAWSDATDDGIAGTTPTKVIEGRQSSVLTGLMAGKQTVSLSAGERAVLLALPQPLNADYNRLTWSSANSSVASISERGVVTGRAKGQTVVTAQIANAEGQSYSMSYSVFVDGVLLRGDVNGDHKVGIGDIIAVTGYMAGTDDKITLEMADVNVDGKVGIGDIIAITDIMAATTNARAYNKGKLKTYFINNINNNNQ